VRGAGAVWRLRAAGDLIRTRCAPATHGRLIRTWRMHRTWRAVLEESGIKAQGVMLHTLRPPTWG